MKEIPGRSTNRTMFRTIGILLMITGAASARAHHNAAATYDLDSEVVHEDVAVVAWRFVNPHAHIVFEAPDSNGNPVQWTASVESVTGLRRRGYSRETLRPGQIVTIKGPPGRNDRPVMYVHEVMLADGTAINFKEPAPAAIKSASEASATGRSDNPLAGYWEFIRGPLSERARALIPDDTHFMPGFGQVSEEEERKIGDAPLTEKGRAFLAQWKDTDDECLTVSGWMGVIAPYLLELEQPRNGRIRINYEYSDLERTVWLDERGFPDVSRTPRTPGGYAVGHWDEDTLVVETRNMHSNLVSRDGIHHSQNAVLRERYSKIGDNLVIVRLLEDPDHFTRPISSVLERRPAEVKEIVPWGECVPNL